MDRVTALHTYLYGPSGAPEIFALHGLTGHGRRWQSMAENQLPDARWIAPDLRGHGRSTWAPPWNIEAHVADLVDTLDEHATGPVLVVAHSFGSALALHLAATAPKRVRGLVLLDPAIGLDPEFMGRIAELTIGSPDYTDAAEARSEKVHGSWGEVPTAVLDEEFIEHLVHLDNGRVNWRLSTPAVVTAWGELARPLLLPPSSMPTVIVQAMKVQPPYVTAEFRSAMTAHLGPNLTDVAFDCDHMVPHVRADEVAALIRKLL
ncbi:alpha/beta fold hydrolase [Rhodococcus sp. ARC_M6]|uniref:alpha/beta fold hydrolase n=1 Tax=Rhodococcus sp. ARC_M6 TaxID=2928852 RepID=UPI001FB411F1|nr:alpha/beta hydrolase [Rhodococcus sp. ARC_M6]MCJ0903518.1 alpha/beta hydrolase [Rhodococcus sp. ARC_M6]